MGETVRMKMSDGVEIAVYRAEPEGKRRGGLVLIQEIFGVNANIREICDLYAAEGYVAMAPDLFWRLEKNVDLGYGDADFKHAFDLYGRFDVARGVRDIAAAVKAMGPELTSVPARPVVFSVTPPQGTYLLAAGFLWWSTRTLRFIPGTAFVLALLTCLDDLPDPGDVDGPGAQPGAVQALTEYSADAAPPQGSRARAQWAKQRAGEDLQAYLDGRAASHGLGPNSLPAEWLSPAYMADAGRHPQVRDHFTRYREYQQEMDTASVTVYLEATRTRLRQSGLRELQVEGVMDAVRKEMHAEAPEIRRRSETEHALISAALDLHAYLEDVDPRVHLDEGGSVRFSQDAERTRAFFLAGEVQRYVDAMRKMDSGGAGSSGGEGRT